MAKIEKGGFVKKTAKSSEPLVLGMSIKVGSFERDDSGRPFVAGTILNEGKMQNATVKLYMENVESDIKIVDRASVEFRGTKKDRTDAKMKECEAGAVLYTRDGVLSKDKDGEGYTVRAGHLDTVTEKATGVEPSYIRISDYNGRKVLTNFTQEAVANEVRGTGAVVAAAMADVIQSTPAADVGNLTFMVRNIATAEDGSMAADNIITLSAWNKDANRAATPDEFVERYKEATERAGFDGAHSVIVGTKHPLSTLMEEGKASALTYAFSELSRGIVAISEVEGGFANAAFINGPKRVNAATGKGYPVSKVNLATLGSPHLPALTSSKTTDVKEKAPDGATPPSAPADDGSDPLAPKDARGRPGAR
jgi:hypothetical protein